MQTVSRLIDTFIPEHYDLSLTLEREKRLFSGIVTIEGNTQPGATEIIVHSKELHIESVLIDGKVASFLNRENDELAITHSELAVGKHIIVIVFDGTITDAMHGLYPCYFEHDGQKKELLATQFESHHAREVFPCIDEPEAKAAFDVTLTTEQDITVLGNMPIKSQVKDRQNLVTTFETSPRMSSYLLAFVTGELHRKTAKTKSGVEVNVWATPAQPADNLDFALEVAVRSIEYYNDFFGTEYPLPKSDHVALPDFSSGAMENWGLITYKEIALLVDKKSTSIAIRHVVATVIAHELAHQWFGNLVTMKWWNDLWLNESFANVMEYIATDALYPDWNIWLDYSTEETIAALRRDSLFGVQAVQVEVTHPDEISSLFDPSIVYAKGGRLIRMVEEFVGTENFKAGLKKYFTTYAYRNTVAEDLWHMLGEASGKDVSSFMQAWLTRPGYPVVHITKVDNSLTLTQEQFYIDGSHHGDQLWSIPLGSNLQELPAVMDKKTLTVTIKEASTIRLNIGDKAHFIAHYDDELFEHILNELRAGTLSSLDKLQLLHEQTLLARAGIISTAKLIPLLTEYANEKNEAVWDIMSLAIGEIRKFVENDKPSRDALRAFVGRLATKQYSRLGWNARPNESEADTKLRELILGHMIYSHDKQAIDTAINMYKNSSLDEINSELRALILSTTVHYSDDETIIDTLLDAYTKTVSPELKRDITVGITSTKRPDQIARLLELIEDPEVVRQQDVIRWFINLLRSRYARTETWKWLRDEWSWIKKTFSGDKSYDDYPTYTAMLLSTPQQLEEYRAFFEPMLSNSALKRAISVGIGEITARIELIERDGDTVRRALLDL